MGSGSAPGISSFWRVLRQSVEECLDEDLVNDRLRALRTTKPLAWEKKNKF